MFPKLLVAVILFAAIGASLLGLRRQQLCLRHDMSELHRQMDQTRRDTWDLQVQIAESTQPAALREAIDRQGLELEPIAPSREELDAEVRRVVRASDQTIAR